MLARFRIPRRIVTSWILSAALALLSAGVVLASETVFPH